MTSESSHCKICNRILPEEVPYCEITDCPHHEEDYDLPQDWEPNYNATTNEERRDKAIEQQKPK